MDGMFRNGRLQAGVGSLEVTFGGDKGGIHRVPEGGVKFVRPWLWKPYHEYCSVGQKL